MRNLLKLGLPASLVVAGCCAKPAAQEQGKPAAHADAAPVAGDGAKTAAAREGLKAIQAGMMEWYKRRGNLDLGSKGIDALSAGANTIIVPEKLIDPWGHKYVWRLTESSYEILSPGPDGKLDTPDDLKAE